MDKWRVTQVGTVMRRQQADGSLMIRFPGWGFEAPATLVAPILSKPPEVTTLTRFSTWDDTMIIGRDARAAWEDTRIAGYTFEELLAMSNETRTNYDGPGIYRHYKGGQYEVIGLALQEDSIDKEGLPSFHHRDSVHGGVTFVIYCPLTPGSLLEQRRETLWARKLSDFNAQLPDGPRFVKLEGHAVSLPIQVRNARLLGLGAEYEGHTLDPAKLTLYYANGLTVLKRAERAEAAARDFAQALDDIASFRPKSYPAFARNALARHPSFSGEEGTDA